MTRAVLVLALLACLSAECIPLMLVLVAAAGICAFIRKPYKECPHCGAHLDPNEKCDCSQSLRERLKDQILRMDEKQLALLLAAWKLREQHPELTTEECVEKAVQGATNTRDGKAEQKSSKLLSSASQFI